MVILNENEEKSAEGSTKKGWVIWAGLALVMLVAVTGYFAWQAVSEKPPAEPAPAPAPPPEPEPEPEPEPPPPPTSTVGSLVVSADVEGASVYVDDEEAGNAPYRASSLEPGTYTIRVVKEGHEPFQQDVRIVAGESARVRAALKKIAAILRVDSDIPGATVFLDRDYLGTTPLEAPEIGLGTHELTASVEGYDMYSETFEMSPEPREIMVRFKEVKLDESVAVVHKHTFGECKGTLRATLTHVIYETDHKDAFDVPWAGLERFEVNYIEKNLNIKVRGGKNYNFTSQSGNPDELFVFHQKVTEAREKLKAMN